MGNCQGKIDCDHDRYSLGLAYEFEADPDIVSEHMGYTDALFSC